MSDEGNVFYQQPGFIFQGEDVIGTSGMPRRESKAAKPMGPKKNKQGHVGRKTQPAEIKGVMQHNRDGSKQAPKVAPTEHKEHENHSSTSPTHDDKGIGIKTKGKSYSRRKLQSNWHRYDEEAESAYGNGLSRENTTEMQTFQELLAKAGASTSRFQFKDERQWNEYDANTSLVLDLDKLASALHSTEIAQKNRLLLVEEGYNSISTNDVQEVTTRSQGVSLNTSYGASNQEQFVWDYGKLKLGKQTPRIEDPPSTCSPSGVAAVTSPKISRVAQPVFDLDDIDELLALSEQHKVAKENKSEQPCLNKGAAVGPDRSQGKDSVFHGSESNIRFHDVLKLEPSSVAEAKDSVKPQVTDEGQELEDWLDEILG